MIKKHFCIPNQEYVQWKVASGAVEEALQIHYVKSVEKPSTRAD